MKISVVIPTCRRVADLERCLERLVPQVADLGDCEVIVTDDGDVESTRAQLAGKFPDVVWTQGPRRGPAANRNHGAQSARGEWLVFLDDDVLPAEKLLAIYNDAIETAGEGVALEGATIRERELPSLLWESPHNPDGGILISCNFAMRKKEFFELGAFDERYPVAAFEDTEFAARFLAKGGAVKFVPAATIIHPLRPRPSARKLARRWEGMVVNARDQGASGFRILWNLPWHVFRVIQSRFRKQKWTVENFRAMGLFAREWLFVLYFTPGWTAKWARLPRSKFWEAWVKQHGPAPKYGF